MLRRFASSIPWLVLLVAVALYLLILPLATAVRPRHEQLFTLPPKVLRIMTLQFKEAAADVAFLNALVFLGGTRTQATNHRYLPEQYEWLNNTLKNSVTLDPYFLDPYYLMNSALIWDQYKTSEVNDLIAKGADARTWDYLLAYFSGFNYYYFLDDGAKSFYYLKEASKRSGGNSFYDSLAALVAYKSNKTAMAIVYLEQQINEAEQKGLKNSVLNIEQRLEILKRINQIEQAVASYHNLFGKFPQNINELVTLKLIVTIPKEPNGGSFYIDANGRVHSTKDLR